MSGTLKAGLWLTITVGLAALGILGWRAAAGGTDTVRWIPEDAAVVRCAISGRNYGLPPLAMELPAPMSPTGLFARVLDPKSLDELGFQRDEVVCASLSAASQSEIDSALDSLPKLLAAKSAVEKDLKPRGTCVCEAARKLGRRQLISQCMGQSTQSDCSVDDASLASLQAALMPLDAALEEADVPLVHWRLAGLTDRPSHFPDHYSKLLSRHTGGSEVFIRGGNVPQRFNHVLISALLEHEGVIAVVRQDSGTALMVVRVMDGNLMVLDHFAYPRVDPKLAPLLAELDNAQVDRYIAMLGAPEHTRELGLDPYEGTFVELDRGALERVDAGLVAAAVLGTRYEESQETRTLPPIWFDRVSLQVPFGQDGSVAIAKLRFTDEGQMWWDGLGETPFTVGFFEANLSEVAPELLPGGEDPGFLLRGKAPDHVWFGGGPGLGQVIRAIEMEAPGSISGKPKAVEIDFPTGPLPGDFDTTREGLRRLRERLSKSRHRLEISRPSGGAYLELRLAPR